MSDATTPQRAKLEVRPTKKNNYFMVHFNASNGETLGLGETHTTEELGQQSRKAWLRAMVEVLNDEGYKVTPPPGPDCPHAAPHRYCDGCKVQPCPIGLDT